MVAARRDAGKRQTDTTCFKFWSAVLFRLAWSDNSGYQHRAAPGAARTGNGDNDTPVQSQSERDSVSSVKPSQAMRAADREPAGGEIPVELVCRQPLGDLPDERFGVSRTNRIALL